MKKTNIARGLVMLLVASICIFGFQSPKKASIAKTASIQAYINPEDMVQGGYYYYWDHGSGAMVAQYDRTENGTIYNYWSITPALLLLQQNSTITLEEAGNITNATLAQISQLLRSILAGIFVP